MSRYHRAVISSEAARERAAKSRDLGFCYTVWLSQEEHKVP